MPSWFQPRLLELDRLLGQARADGQVWLPKLETHPAGSILGVAGLALGVWSANGTSGLHQVAGWVALTAVCLGMLLHAVLLSRLDGWVVDFTARSVQPKVGGEAVPLSGEGWSVVCAPGDRRATVVIDLRRADVGRVARLFEPVGRANGALQRRISALADVLAERLATERSGPRL